MRLTNLLSATGAGAALLAGCSAADGGGDRKPNVIFILADDLGIGDLGCYGQARIETPEIDRLAADGMVFTRHYSGSTVSAPSRCVLLTGKHTGHSYIRGNKSVEEPDGDRYDYPLAAGETTVADLLKESGYATACIGKWGLGGPASEGHPNNHGFDYFYGYLGQRHAHRYYPQFLWENKTRIELNGKRYSHDLIVEKALGFIERNSDRPFFLYFTPTIPHADLAVPSTGLGRYDGMFEETPFESTPGGYTPQPKPRAAFAAMVMRLDSDVGRIVALLREKGILENTMIVFTSDNGTHSEGGHDPDYFDSNGIFRGQKRDLYEGGIRTPFIVHYPAAVAKGSRTRHISAFWDFLPTMCEMTGTDVPEGLDGISCLPTLTGRDKRQKEHDHLYFEFHERGGKRAVIKDGWKLVELDVNDPDKTRLELYDLDSNPSETRDIINENTALAAELYGIMQASRTPSEIWEFRTGK